MAPVSFDIPYRTYQRCTSRKSKGILITYLFSTQSFAELLASWAARCIWVALSSLDMDTMIQFLVRCRPHLDYGCCGGIATGWTASICSSTSNGLDRRQHQCPSLSNLSQDLGQARHLANAPGSYSQYNQGAASYVVIVF